MKDIDLETGIGIVVALVAVWALLIFGGPLSAFNPFIFFFG